MKFYEYFKIQPQNFHWKHIVRKLKLQQQFFLDFLLSMCLVSRATTFLSSPSSFSCGSFIELVTLFYVLSDIFTSTQKKFEPRNISYFLSTHIPSHKNSRNFSTATRKTRKKGNLFDGISEYPETTYWGMRKSIKCEIFREKCCRIAFVPTTFFFFYLLLLLRVVGHWPSLTVILKYTVTLTHRARSECRAVMSGSGIAVGKRERRKNNMKMYVWGLQRGTI